MKTKETLLGAVLVVAVALTQHPRPSLAQPAPNLALTFDGTNDQVIVPNRAALELTDGTLELWFRPDWTPGAINYDPVLIANRLGAALTRYSLQVDRNLAGVMLANGTSVSTVPCNFTPGEWVHLEMTHFLVWMQGYANIDLISHSWGTTLTCDLQNISGIETRHWVTMGSPLKSTTPKPLGNTGDWINMYDSNDLITHLEMFPPFPDTQGLPLPGSLTGPGLVENRSVNAQHSYNFGFRLTLDDFWVHSRYWPTRV